MTLSITRRVGERIRLDVPGLAGPVWLWLGDAQRDKGRIVIDAPKEVVIMREELLPIDLAKLPPKGNSGRPEGYEKREE